MRKTQFWRLVVLVFTCLRLSSVSSQNNPDNMVAYEEKFLMGVRSYALSRWSDAIIHISQAMDEYEQLERARVKCFNNCKAQKIDLPNHHEGMLLQQEFFYVAIHRAHCIRECEEEMMGLIYLKGGVSNHILNQLRSREGYNYLQMALYQEGKHKEAAKACSNFKYFNPQNVQINKNMIFYKNNKDVTEGDLNPGKPWPYRELFAEGHRLFYAKDWTAMVTTLEKSLTHFYEALDECKTLCDSPQKYDAMLEFPQVVSVLALETMSCRVKCVSSLGEFRSDFAEDFFGNYFHYLQQGYHHLNQSLQALQASAAHVRLMPYSGMPKRNSVHYLRQPGVTRKDFHPKKDLLPEIVKREEDLSMLRVFKQMMDANRKEEEGENEEEGLDQTLLEEDFLKYPVGLSYPVKPLTLENVQPLMLQSAADFGGLERMVADQVLSDGQCRDLMQLASFGHEGDGYSRKNPHSLREKFVGLNILEAAKRAVEGEYNKHLTWLYINSSRVAKDLVAREFGIQAPLYFSFTHLVCRTALEDLQGSRKDLSHPVHSDNCVLNELTASCDKSAPAFTWRDYSALLYLNEDIEGGDFFFARSLEDLSPDVRVRPKCGRLVGFSAGEENLHGVTAVTKGRRCAVALWFTLDPDHQELTFDSAADLLSED